MGTISLNDLLTKESLEDALKTLSFEDGLKLLEELVSKVEAGSLSLDKAVLSYEKGALLIDHLRTLLSGAEEKLKILSKNPG